MRDRTAQRGADNGHTSPTKPACLPPSAREAGARQRRHDGVKGTGMSQGTAMCQAASSWPTHQQPAMHTESVASSLDLPQLNTQLNTHTNLGGNVGKLGLGGLGQEGVGLHGLVKPCQRVGHHLEFARSVADWVTLGLQQRARNPESHWHSHLFLDVDKDVVNATLPYTIPMLAPAHTRACTDTRTCVRAPGILRV